MLGQAPPGYHQGVEAQNRQGRYDSFMGAADAGRQLGAARDAQADAMGMYRDAALGQGPSVAQAQLQAQGEQDARRQMQMQAAARGGNMAGQMRAATMAGAAQAQQTRDSLAALRAQEQAAAMQGYAGMADAQAQQAMQQQMQYEQLGLGYAGQQMGYDMHLRDAAAQSRRDRFGRRMQVYGATKDAAGTVLSVLGGGGMV
jgi:hypothetical protein